MNPGDEDFEELQKILYEYRTNAAEELGEVSKAKQDKIQSRFGPNATFVKLRQRILKREWERLKEDLKEPQNLYSPSLHLIDTDGFDKRVAGGDGFCGFQIVG